MQRAEGDEPDGRARHQRHADRHAAAVAPGQPDERGDRRAQRILDDTDQAGCDPGFSGMVLEGERQGVR